MALLITSSKMGWTKSKTYPKAISHAMRIFVVMGLINKLFIHSSFKSKIMNANATVQQLKDLKLSGMVRSYESVLQMPVQKQPEAHAMLAQMCDAESQHRVHYKTQFFLKLSKLRYAAMLEEIAYTKERNL